MADPNQEAEELENWIDDTREKIFKVRLAVFLVREPSCLQNTTITIIE